MVQFSVVQREKIGEDARVAVRGVRGPGGDQGKGAVGGLGYAGLVACGADTRPAAPLAKNAGTGGQGRVLRLEVITLTQIDRCGDQLRTAASALL